ncbi:major facilitator superfamily domain-containing protein [Naematelia encephala]|uniref:Major facilitator superfamily domain-containing protein n=1 Tax=Naematelia encephala TaxID=71784 RepID=A0A1Y2AVZ3_9TREE|nr:major facilitator superfamily domain-containing protein [Naematelia encephala]
MNVAIGFIAKDLKFEAAQVQWIQSAYELSSGCLLLLYVPLTEQFGARPIVLFGGAFFCVWAIACANAQTAIQFIIFRALEGVGICAVVPAGFGVLAQMLPITEGSKYRNTLIAIFAAGAPLGSGLGTIFGGLPTQYSHIQWRGIFAVMAGVSGTATILCGFTIPPSKVNKVKGGVDYLGASLVTISLTLIIFCLAQGPAVGWNTGYVVALLTIGCVTLFVFGGYEWWLERRDKTPMLRMSNFTRGRYAVVNVLGMIGFGCFITWDYWAGLYYAQVLGYDAKNIMLRYLPQSIGGMIGGPLTTLLLRRISTQFVFMFGCACATFGAMTFALANVTDTYWNGGQFFAFFLSITGASVIYQSGMLYCVSVVVPSEMTAAGGLFQVMTSLASSFGLVFSTIVATAHVSETEPIKEYTYGFWTAVSFGAFAFVAAIPGLWGIGVLHKTGETARVEELVVHHHEDEVIHHHVHNEEYTQSPEEAA